MEKETGLNPEMTKARLSHVVTQALGTGPLKPDELKDLRGILQRLTVRKGDRLAEDVVARTIDNMIASVYTREKLRVEIEQMRAGLGDASASMIERLLIDQIVMCYLRMWFAEFGQTAREQQGITPEQSAEAQKVLGLAQTRYLRAIETLAKVRRLKLPAAQLNLGGAGAGQLSAARLNLGVPDDPGNEYAWMFKGSRQTQKAPAAQEP